MIALLLAGCVHPVRTESSAGTSPRTDKYDAGVLSLAAGFAAKETCSCRFVQGRTAEECAAWVRVSPDVARVWVDPEARTVEAKALGFARTTARYVDGQGCRLEL
ncbi:MAG: hypothetical protein ABMA64_18345 [Myxococcota bacterium]